MRTIHNLSENFSDGLLFPKGTSAERGNPEAGYFRYNTETKGIEVYDGTSWSSMDNTPSYVTDGLVLNLDAGNLNSYDGSGITWSDLSQEGNDGTINGATYDSNGYFTFDGSNDDVTVNSSSPVTPDTGDFSVEIIYMLKGSGSRGGVHERVNGSAYNGLSFGQGGNNSWTFYITGTSNYNNGLTVYFSYPTLNIWNHDIGVYSGGNTVSAYRNGSFVDSQTGSQQGNLSQQGVRSPLIIAKRDATSSPLPSDFAIVRVYDKALSSDEITQNFNATKTRFGL